MISARTVAALAAAKARGVALGGHRGDISRMEAMAAIGTKASAAARGAKAAKRNEDLLPVIKDIRESGITTLRSIAAELNARGITTPRSGQWSAVQVQRVLSALQGYG
jgi:DNA invertase Pin-like site-specific DNA recombinase